MDITMRISLLVISALVLVIAFFNPFERKQRRSKGEEKAEPVVNYQNNKTDTFYQTKKASHSTDNVLTIMVHAKPGMRFEAYDLLQAISSSGMQFGEMNIFHYYAQQEHGRSPLFSLASATKPGDFDINNMGNFSCAGLVLFMQLDHLAMHPKLVFHRMLATAEQLAEDLDGVLLSSTRAPWSDEIMEDYQQQISQCQSHQFA